MIKQQIADHPEVTAFFERMTFLPAGTHHRQGTAGQRGVSVCTSSRWKKAIETENQSVDVEHISPLTEKYDGKYAAGPCSCRMSRAAMGGAAATTPTTGASASAT